MVAILITIFDYDWEILNKLIPENFENDYEEYCYYMINISNYIFKINWEKLTYKIQIS